MFLVLILFFLFLDECVRLKQIIGFALQKVPLLSDWTDVLIDAILLTINALYSAPRTSPLADVNVENIAKFLLALCKISNKVSTYLFPLVSFMITTFRHYVQIISLNNTQIKFNSHVSWMQLDNVILWINLLSNPFINFINFNLKVLSFSNHFQVDYLHSTIAVRLVKEMTEYPKSKMNTIYSKILLMLDIPNGKTRIDELLDNCYNLVQVSFILDNIASFIPASF